ncbi:MAG: sulfate respiration complex hexadecaheme cytochrome HmcA [Thermodesulfobacteriota bacterium]
MEERKQRIPRSLAFLALCGVAGLLALAVRLGHATPQEDEGFRADIMSINVLKDYGPITQPDVVFLHDKHTSALSKLGEKYKEQCNTCHLKDKDGKTSLAFKRLANPAAGSDLKEIYHDGCIGCHADLAKAGLKSGPSDVQCKSCHAGEPAVKSSWQPLAVDPKLHFRHARTEEKKDNKCGACHHIYDATAKKNVPAPKEDQVPGACAYCHKATETVTPGGTPEKVRSQRLAAHDACVTCHQQTAAKGPNTPSGPISCSGCHAPLSQKNIEANNLKQVPEGADLRIKRQQPDRTLILAQTPPTKTVDGKPVKAFTMNAVPFDHKAHEARGTSCATCHHQTLASCGAKCHTVAGSKEGGQVPLAQAMHSPTAEASCVSCHAKEQKKPECAGCHAQRKPADAMDKSACASCHMTPAPGAAETVAALAQAPASPAREQERARLAGQLLDARTMTTQLYPVDDIPENVTIGSLAKDYEPSVFPHRRIVQVLAAALKENRLANAFHADEGALCRGCHHMSPPSKKPPHCVSCHAATGPAPDGRPGLKAALHGQCMGCHKAMGIEGKLPKAAEAGAKPVPLNTDCAGCHKEAKK